MAEHDQDIDEKITLNDELLEIERLLKKIPRSLFLLLENVIIFISVLFLPLFQMIYDIQGIIVLVPLSGRILGVFPYIIAIISAYMIFLCNMYGLKRRKLKNIRQHRKRRHLVVSSLNSLANYSLVMTISHVLLIIFLILFYHSYLINYDETIANDPLRFIPPQVLYHDLPNPMPSSYSWFLKIYTGSYILISAALLSFFHEIIVFFRIRKIKKKILPIIDSLPDLEKKTTPTVEHEEKSDMESITYELEDDMEKISTDSIISTEKQEPLLTSSDSEMNTTIEASSTMEQSQEVIAAVSSPFRATKSSIEPPIRSTGYLRNFKPPKLRPCSNCNTKIPMSAKFCYECGTPAS